MRVLAVASSGRLGGAELALVEFLRHRPPTAEVQVLQLGGGALQERLAVEGIEASVARGLEGRPSARRVAGLTRSLLRLLDGGAFDVVLAIGLKAACLTVPAARIAGVPIVWSKVDFSHDAVLARPLAAAVNGVVCVSEAAATALGPLRARRLLAVVGPPVRLPELPYRHPVAERPTIGTLAALTPYKGQRVMLRAAAILAEEFPDIAVVLAGEEVAGAEGYRAELESLARELGLAARVELSGFVEDVGGVLGRLHVYVNATHQDERGYGLEGLSGAMLEASWCGLPVVATRGGGTPEGILDGVTGSLVEQDDPAGLARAIAPYLRDPLLARSVGESGMRFVRERFAPAPASARLFAALERTARGG